MGKKKADRTEVEISSKRLKASLPADQASAVGSNIEQLVSPLVEGAGLIGDYIRFFRQKAALNALKRVRELAAKSKIELKPVPPKFLIPWIESVSLESAEDETIVEMWSQLLLTASRDRENCRPLFVDVLKKIGNKEAVVLEKMWRPLTQAPHLEIFTEASFRECGRAFKKSLAKINAKFERVDRSIEQNRDAHNDEVDRLLAQFVEELRKRGFEPTVLEFSNGRSRKTFHDVEKTQKLPTPKQRSSIELYALAALQLIREDMRTADLDDDEFFTDTDEFEPVLKTKFFRLSPFGLEFMNACHGTIRAPIVEP